MKLLLVIGLFLSTTLLAQELKIKAKFFQTDEKSGITIFKGNVDIRKGSDSIVAQKVVVSTDKNNKPTKFVATQDVVFSITTKTGAIYKGKAQKVIFLPKEKEYHFYTDVYLEQVDDKKKIIGEKVVLKIVEGKAYAKGVDEKPVVMVFDIKDDKEDLLK